MGELDNSVLSFESFCSILSATSEILWFFLCCLSRPKVFELDYDVTFILFNLCLNIGCWNTYYYDDYTSKMKLFDYIKYRSPKCSRDVSLFHGYCSWV